MLFSESIFLWFLAGISIPVIIHLFNFRKFKKVYFSNVSFIEELKVQTHKHSKLKHLIILFLRIFAIISLIFAFAQPYIPSVSNNKTLKGHNVISIFIDNSFSMQSINNQQKLLDIAKIKAHEIIDAYSNTDEFQLLTQDFEGKHQNLYSKDDFIQMLDEVTISPSIKTFSEIIKRQKDALLLSHQSNKICYIITDNQKSTCDFEKIQNDTIINFYIIPLTPQKSNNVYIDSCWFDSPIFQINKNVRLFVKIKNESEINLENIPVKLFINGKQRAVASVNIENGGESVINIPYRINEKGYQEGYAEITDYPITYDDKFFFSYFVADKINILSINGEGENKYLNKIYSLDSVFNLVNISEKNIDYSSIFNNNLVIINGIKTISSGLSQSLKKYTENSGNLLIFPSAAIDFQSYKLLSSNLKIQDYENIDTVNNKVEKINLQHQIFTDVFEKIPENIDLPTVYSYYNLINSSRIRKESLLSLLNQKDFLTIIKSGNGKVYQSSVPLDAVWSNFPKHPIFVPIMFNIALLSQPQIKMYYTIGNDEIVEVSNIKIKGDEIFKLKSNDSDFEIIPEHNNENSRLELFFHNQIKEAGNYKLNKGDELVLYLSYNYNRNESKLDFFKPDEIEKRLKDFQLKNFKIIESENKSLMNIINEINQGTKLWKWFVLLTLVFLLTETLLLRFWK